MNKAKGEIKLVFPTEEYKEQMEEYLQEHIENNEFDIAGDGSLDTIKDFDKWLEKIKNDVSAKTVEGGRVPATLFLGVRKSDNKVVGTIQIRHVLNEKLLKNGGHIGYGVRPSERRKGYVTEMTTLALEECKKIGINRALLVCYKDNDGSRKNIINHGGVLENEIEYENGKIDQRYWISLKKKFADSIKDYEEIVDIEQKIKPINNEDFKGDIFLNNLLKVSPKYTLENGLCIADDNYKWLEFYDYSKRVRLTAVYDNKNEIVEWYFDIAREIGKENGVPYEDDLYLDVVLGPNGEMALLDEDEFEEAYQKYEFTKEEYDEAYKIANDLMKTLNGKADEMKKFTDKYLKIILEEK